jgi:hypothetical protein
VHYVVKLRIKVLHPRVPLVLFEKCQVIGVMFVMFVMCCGSDLPTRGRRRGESS